MSENADVGAAALHVVAALRAAGFPCAIGGALALGVWGVPRATLDVDLDVFVDPVDYERLADVLSAAGLTFDRATLLRQANEGSTLVARLGAWRIDLFVPTIPFYALAERRVRTVSFLGTEVPFLDAESLAVFKLLFFRTKDLRDLERLVAVAGPQLDRAWVRAQIVDMLGDDDARVEEWDRIVRLHG